MPFAWHVHQNAHEASSCFAFGRDVFDGTDLLPASDDVTRQPPPFRALRRQRAAFIVVLGLRAYIHAMVGCEVEYGILEHRACS